MKLIYFPLLLLFLFNHCNMADSKPNTQFSLWQLIDGETKVIPKVFFSEKIPGSSLDYFKISAVTLENNSKISPLAR